MPFLVPGTPRFIFKSKREFELHIPVLLEMRHGDREERDGLLVRVIREDRADQLLGDLCKRSRWRRLARQALPIAWQS